ncbi:HDOD domain-containing protein [Pseudoduganella violaceinigra]|uniref:HDOD domain-containing protein n=1 Tax=Pseudoduganella violaceinigra TaxID=246602 RepID=UPI000408C00C|nr:HDOD domain-containing protein [Pseudoduganella violaceinigra]
MTALAEQTLAMLWERTRQQGDMPGFAKAITAILSVMRGEDDKGFDLTRTVLSDPVLTQKVLRLANSGMYSAFGQKINTVSKAMLILGTEAIGHLALGLKLIEELSVASPDSGLAHIEMEKAVLAGMVAREVAATAESRHGEEAVVCSMLHALGRMLVTFYMPERWTAMQLAAGEGKEDEAALEILGLSLQDIGREAAAQWGLPDSLLAGMRTIEPPADGMPSDPLGREDWVASVSTMANLCAGALWNDDAEGAAEVKRISARYASMIGVSADKLAQVIEHAKVAAASDLTIAPLSKPAERRAKQLAQTRQRAAGNNILLSGLSEMRNSLDSASAGQMVSMALETIFKGLQFSRAVAFVRNRRESQYAARMCLGEGVRQHLPAMHFVDAYEPNVFHAALSNDRVIFIDNAADPKFAAKLPAWWRDTLNDARSFVVLPLCSNGQPTGFLYGDWDDSFPAIQLSPAEFSLLNDIRAVVVKAAERRHQAGTVNRAA